jgi:hypothetical protein
MMTVLMSMEALCEPTVVPVLMTVVVLVVELQRGPDVAVRLVTVVVVLMSVVAVVVVKFRRWPSPQLHAQIHPHPLHWCSSPASGRETGAPMLAGDSQVGSAPHQASALGALVYQ